MLQQRNDSQNPSPTPIHDESWRWCSESCHWKSPRETAHSWQVAVNDDEVNCIACLRKSLSAPLATSWLETLPQTPSDKSKGHEKRLHWDKHSSGSPARKLMTHGNWNQLHGLFDRQVTGDFDGGDWWQLVEQTLRFKPHLASDACTWKSFKPNLEKSCILVW